MPIRFAVIGRPIAHSLSPFIHQQFARQTNVSLRYEKIKGCEKGFEKQVVDFFDQGGQGLNCTHPFKQRAFAMANVTTQRCQLAAAANTLWMKAGQLHADNTDGIGLLRDLARYIDLKGCNMLVLGAGGAARGIIHPLSNFNPASLTISNRTLSKAKELQMICPIIQCLALHELSDAFDVVINATSASLHDQPLQLPKHCLSNQPLCYDLTYQPHKDTPFLSQAKHWGCKAIDGRGMLIEQAAESFFIWHGVMPSTEPLFNETVFLR